MTTPSGSIGIGVSIDADDLTSEITRAVQSAMSDVLRSVRTGMGQVEGALGGIDTSGFADIAQAAREAAEQADWAARDTASSVDRTGQQIDRSAQQAARSVNTSLSRIDASSLSRIASGADDAMDHLRQLDRWQLQALTAEVNRAGQNIGQEIGAGASHAERTLGQLDSASLENLLRSINDVTREMNGATDETEQLSSRFEGLGSRGDGLVKNLAGVAAGVAGVGAAMDTVGAAIEQADLNNKLAAQLNLDPAESEKAGRIAGTLYAGAYGESMEQVNDAVGAVVSSLGNLTDTSEGEIQSLTTKALDLSAAFGVDVAQSAQTANNLIRNGLAKDGAEAFDLITASMQTVPAQMRDEIFPVMDEYSTYFQSIGLSGTEAMGLITNAAQGGAIGMDKAGDAIKEFGIRATDIGDKGAVEAMESMGLNATDMANALLAGGDTARDAFQQIVTGLQGITDPAEQASAAVALFGTPLEDLDKAKIPGFLAGLSNADSALGDVTGRAEAMGETLNSGPGVALETFKRTLQQSLVDGLGSTVQYFQENEGVAKALAVALGALATAYVGMRVASAASAVALGIHTAATGGNTAALAANRLAMGAAAVASGVMRVGQLAGAAATGVATAAQWAFNAALSANPITLIVIAIAGLVAGLVAFFTKTELGRELWSSFVEFLASSWETVKGAFQAAWEFISPILSGIWDFVSNVLVGAFNTLVSVVTTVFDAIGAVISYVWNSVVMPVFNVWQTVIMGIIVPILMFLWNSVVVPVFQGIGNIIKTVWDTVISVVFDAIKVGIDALGAAANWLWNNVFVPVWNGIGAAISFVWETIILPAFDAIKAGMDGVGAAASWLWNNVITPVWNGIGDTIRWVIDNVITPAWEGMKSGLQAVGDFFSTVVTGIGNVWNGLRNLLAKPINFLIGTVYNEGIRKAWNKIGEFIPGLVTAPELPTIPEYRTGGALRGPGTGTSDDILMWGSNGEHMVTAAEVLAAGGHGVLYAIRDMIARGIPFSWDNGRVISTIGEGNLSRYGTAVQRKGLGNVEPEGLFNPLLAPKYKDGGAIELQPWMLQLAKGHRFAQAQHGKPYQWAGPTGPGSSFDCSGFMGSIAAEILGGDPWRRYWATASFAGYPTVGPQGFTKGLGAGFTIGVTDDPGGPGGGHTAGVLGEVPGMFGVARVESGGAIGDVHYGAGPDVRSFAGVYTLPIGANGFFQPGEGLSVGPTPEEQRSFLGEKVHDVLTAITDPIKGAIVGAVGSPPPHWRSVPPKYLDAGADAVADGTDAVIDGLGDMLSSAWTAAKGLGSSLLDTLNPFDSGGLAFGKGFLPKNVIAPERVLSPEQTKLFEILVTSLQALANGDYDGGLSRVGIQEDHPFVDAALTMQEIAASVDALVNRGDYDGTMSRFGVQEDHPLIDAVLTMREVATSVDALVAKGDYDGTLSRFGIQEDDPVVDAVLTMRDTALAVQDVAGSVGTLVEKGDYDGTLSSYGIQEDHPVIDAILDVRDAVVEALGSSASKVAGDIVAAMAPTPRDLAEKIDPDTLRFMQDTQAQLTEQGEIISETAELAKRNESSTALVVAEQYRQIEKQLVEVTNRLTGGVLGPVVQSAMQSALGLVAKALEASTGDITAAQDKTTEAVKDIDVSGGSTDPAPPFGAPGSAFDFATELSNAVVSVTDTASQAILQVGMDIAKAALQQQKSTVDNSRGVLGDENNSGGFLVDTIVRLTGVEIQIRDTIYAVADEIKKFRGEQFQTFDETGALLSDTASLLERSASSTDLVIAEQNRINRELIKAVLRYLMLNVVLPILMALMTAMITVAVTAIGAAIGAAIGGPIGLALGAALGGIIGLALSAAAAAVIGGIGLGAGAAIDSFDQGGIASGIGVLPKNTVQPERVLSPRQTASFERLVDLLDGSGLSGGGSRTVQIGSMTVQGTQAAEKTSDKLLSLLNS
ncbi:hypothetical protein [Rhodococcus ruber]|uniref:hypothetical protein n=1 Tax=Rhodococcus ruber TaxID=1830 RepID=UPI003D81A747